MRASNILPLSDLINTFKVLLKLQPIVNWQYFPKKATISVKIVCFLKSVGELRQLIRKRSRKNNKDEIVDYISVPIYQVSFRKFCPMQKQ